MNAKNAQPVPPEADVARVRIELVDRDGGIIRELDIPARYGKRMGSWGVYADSIDSVSGIDGDYPYTMIDFRYRFVP